MSSQLETQVGSRFLLFYSARTNFGQIVLDARELNVYLVLSFIIFKILFYCPIALLIKLV